VVVVVVINSDNLAKCTHLRLSSGGVQMLLRATTRAAGGRVRGARLRDPGDPLGIQVATRIRGWAGCFNLGRMLPPLKSQDHAFWSGG
jgi:hypothetical protein